MPLMIEAYEEINGIPKKYETSHFRVKNGLLACYLINGLGMKKRIVSEAVYGEIRSHIYHDTMYNKNKEVYGLFIDLLYQENKRMVKNENFKSLLQTFTQ